MWEWIFFAKIFAHILVCHPSQACLHCNARCRNFDIDDNGRTPAWRWTYYAQVDIVEIVRHAGIVRREGGHWELTWRASVRSVQSIPTLSQLTQSHSTLGAGRQLVTHTSDSDWDISTWFCQPAQSTVVCKVWDCRLCWFCQYCHCCLKLNPILSLTKSEL